MTKEELFTIAGSKHELRMSYYIDEGFKIFKKNVGGFLGIVIVNILISWALSIIPVLGGVLSYFAGSFVTAGMILVCRKIRNGEETQFNDFFEVFKNPGPFLILLLVQVGMLVLVGLPAIVIFFSMYYKTLFGGGTPSMEAMLAIIPLMFFVLIPVLFLSMCYIFSFHIYLFIHQDFWVAMEASRKFVMKNWLSVLGFLIIVGLLFAVITICTCGLGYFVMMPVAVASIYMAFESIFKPSANTFENKIESFGSQQRDINTEADEKFL
jgi:hypothetical protein